MRSVKIFLAFALALWGLFGVLFNVLGWGMSSDYVRSVASMSFLPEDQRPPYATDHAAAVFAGMLVVLAGKLLPLIGGGVGSIRMLTSLGAPKERFAEAKKWAIIGAFGGFGFLFLGFMVFGEMLYGMYLDQDLEKAAQAAWRYAGAMGLIGLFLAQDE